MTFRNKNTLRKCITYQVGVMANSFVDQRAKKRLLGFLKRTEVKNQIKLKMCYFYENCYKIQVSFRSMKLQGEMNIRYCILRFKQDLNRLKFYYLKKAKNKTCAKIFSKLEEIDMVDGKTQI